MNFKQIIGGTILVIIQLAINSSTSAAASFTGGLPTPFSPGMSMEASLYLSVMMVLDNIMGIFGAILIILGCTAKKRAEKKAAQEAAEEKAKANDPNYIRASISQMIRMTCERMKDDPDQLQSYLENCVKDRRITDIQKEMLLEEYLPVD